MQYYDFLEVNKKEIVDELEVLLTRNKVQPVGSGYIDCIVMKENFEGLIKELSDLGLLIECVSWWCYVDPNVSSENGCPHGMGGPRAVHYDGWFSELQNKAYEIEDKVIEKALSSYDKELIYSLNMTTFNTIRSMLKQPFRYTPIDYIPGNKCVNPALWLLVPNNWKRKVYS